MFTNRCLELAAGCLFTERPTPADWQRVQRELALRIPETHMRFVSRFGSGRFGDDLYIQNPRASGMCRLGHDRLVQYAESHALLLDELKRKVYPESRIVLVAATTSRHDFFLDLGAARAGENVLLFDFGMLRVLELGMTFPEFVCRLYLHELQHDWAEGLRHSIWSDDAPFFTPISTE